MFTNTTFAWAFRLASAARAPAAMNAHGIAPSQDGYTVNNPAGARRSSDIGFVVWASIVLIGLAILSIGLGLQPME